MAQDPLDARPGWVYRSDAPVPVPAAAPEAPSPTAERFEPGRATPAAPRDWVASGLYLMALPLAVGMTLMLAPVAWLLRSRAAQ